MKRFLINAGRLILNLVYAAMKLARQRDKVVLISRQGDQPSIDFKMLNDELKSRGIETVVLCRTLDKGLIGLIKYSPHMLVQMRAIATSKVLVLDSYCIVVSMLKPREDLEVIQMWHALGAMKKFGLSILDMPEGHKSSIAIPMRMHRGYTQILTSSESSRVGFAEAFGYSPDMITIMSLPRVDAILDANRNAVLRKQIAQKYPQTCNGKENILYIPTHRIKGDMNLPIGALIDSIDKRKYNLIIKAHPLTKLDIESSQLIITDEEFESVDMLAISDYVVTDYSAMTYEAALKGLPLFFYAYDKEKYFNSRSFYLDYDQEMPGPICTDAEAVANAIETCDRASLEARSRAFADKYVEKQRDCTKEMADFIKTLLSKQNGADKC